MPIRLTIPTQETFVLERCDEIFGNTGEPTRVTIKQARRGEDEERQRIWSEVQRSFSIDGNTDEITLRQNWTLYELFREEVRLTLIDCNIEDDKGEPLFKFSNKGGYQHLAMTQAEFKTAWGRLDSLIADEIHEKVLEVNIDWAGPLA